MEIIGHSATSASLGQSFQLKPALDQVNQFQQLLGAMSKGMSGGQPAGHPIENSRKILPNQSQLAVETPNPIEELALRVNSAEHNMQALRREVNQHSNDMKDAPGQVDQVVTNVVGQQLASASYFVYLNHMGNGVSNFTDELDSVTKRR